MAYHFDTVARAAHLFRGEDGQPMPMARLMETVPVLELSPGQRAEAGRIADGLARELGLASLQEEGQLFSSLNAVSLLVQLTVLFARQALSADRPADAQGPDHRELLRYMYLALRPEADAPAAGGCVRVQPVHRQRPDHRHDGPVLFRPAQRNAHRQDCRLSAVHGPDPEGTGEILG